jgi:hypothetical protein
MLLNILTGIAVTLLCLFLQASVVAIGLRRYVRFKVGRTGEPSRRVDFLFLSTVMVMMMAGILAQIAIWAVLFMLIGEFADFKTALYHSGVNFAGLGYGDIVMSEDRRLLGPIEAANGILMFGLAAAMMTAAVMDIIKHNSRRLQPPAAQEGEEAQRIGEGR